MSVILRTSQREYTFTPNEVDMYLMNIPVIAKTITPNSILAPLPADRSISFTDLEDELGLIKVSAETMNAYFMIITGSWSDEYDLFELIQFHNYLGRSFLFNDMFYSKIPGGVVELSAEDLTALDRHYPFLSGIFPDDTVMINDELSREESLEFIHVLFRMDMLLAVSMSGRNTNWKRLLYIIFNSRVSSYGDKNLLSELEEDDKLRIVEDMVMSSARIPDVVLIGAILNIPDYVPIWRVVDHPESFYMRRYRTYLRSLSHVDQVSKLTTSSRLRGSSLGSLWEQYNTILRSKI